jgi:hypothetical protein
VAPSRVHFDQCRAYLRNLVRLCILPIGLQHQLHRRKLSIAIHVVAAVDPFLELETKKQIPQVVERKFAFDVPRSSFSISFSNLLMRVS